MRNILKATTLENKFPLFTVENGCIVSKDADITVAFRVELPELFTVTAAEYEAIHSAWNKAVKVLPDYSIVHKQDWFIKENYAPDIQKDNLSFLSRSFERHFNERPFLNHTCYLFLTKTTKERSRMQSNFSTLCRGFLVPKEIKDRETVTKFLEAVGQFESIMNDSGFITLTRLNSDEITGTREAAGIVEKYFSLSQTDTTTLKDISLGADKMKIGDDILCLHTLSDAEDMPGKVGTDTRYEKLSTDRSDCRLSFASPVGVLLSCNHIYNQYIFIDDHTENLKQFEKMARNMHSLSKYSRANQINKSWIEEYLNEAHSQGLISVRCHCNIMAWSDDRDELKHIKNDVGSQLALMECKPRHNTTDTATSHERLFFVEVMGHTAGYLALNGAIASGAEAAIIPEMETEDDQLKTLIDNGFRKSKNSAIVLVAENPNTGGAMGLAERVKREYPQYDARVTILGHLQRGGSPTAMDRILSSRLGATAITALKEGQRNVMIGIRNGEMVYVPFPQALSRTKNIRREDIDLVKVLSI